MAVSFFRMECLSNMHAGNGDVNYNIIDNEVERDINGYPTVNASGMKGALREYFLNKISADKVDELFGKSETGKTTPGKLRILAAEMLAIPMRATAGNAPFWLVTTQAALDRYAKLRQHLGLPDILLTVEDAADHEAAEGVQLRKKLTLWGKTLYIMEPKDFTQVSLPVLARNKLDNGISKTLWYEEVVPHESLFYFPVLAEDGDLLNEFTELVSGKVVQFGGNASIGYGLCSLTKDEGVAQ